MRVTLSCGSLGILILIGVTARAGDFKPEPGYTSLFNGKDLTGWKTKKGESLEGKTETPEKRFKVQDGKLVLDPQVKGDIYIYTIKEFAKDVHIKFEFLPGKGCNNDLFLRGLKFDIIPKAIKNIKEDEWNELEIIVQGDKVEWKCNGETARRDKAKNASSTFGLRAEYGPIQYRKMRVKETAGVDKTQQSTSKKHQKLYITNSAGNDVTIVDVATNKIIKTLEVGPHPHGIAAPDSCEFILVTIEGGKTGQLVWIDPVKDEVTQRIPIGPAPNQLAVTPDGRFAYVPVDNGTWEVIDVKQAKIVEHIKTGGRPHNTLCSADGKFMYLAPMGKTREVTIVEVAGHKIVGAIPFGESVRPVALSQDGTKFYANVDGLIGFEMADIAKRKVIARAQADLTPEQQMVSSRSHGLCLRPGGQEIWTCDVEHHEVQIFDLTGDAPKQAGKIAMGGRIYWLTFSPDGKLAYISVRSKGQIAVVDTKSRQIVARIQAGLEPKRLIVVNVAMAERKE